jgi:putative urate catabolism protein
MNRAQERTAMNDGKTYPRDLAGYRGAPPHARWPGGARIAVQFVLNYEEGGENSVLHGDAGAETFLSEIINAPEVPGARHMSMESLYEYGSRAGVWRVIRLFRDLKIPITVFAVASALERNPCVVDEFLLDGHEICSHGFKWINYQTVSEATERAHIAKAVAILKSLTGAAPEGWYTGRTSPNTRRLVVEHGGFLYDADDYSDDLPFWTKVAGKNHLVVPYALDANDMRFATAQGFNSGEQFFAYLRDAFDVLYAEGATAPKMMSVGLHGRLIGRPGRFAALERFVRYVADKPDVWLCRRIDIARHWIKTHPPP